MTHHAANPFYSSDPAHLTAVYTFTGALSVRHHDVPDGWDRLDQPPGPTPSEPAGSGRDGNGWTLAANLTLKTAGYVPAGEWYRRDTGHFSKGYAIEVREVFTRAEIQRLAELDAEREDDHRRNGGMMDPVAAKRRSTERRAIYKAANDRQGDIASN